MYLNSSLILRICTYLIWLLDFLSITLYPFFSKVTEIYSLLDKIIDEKPSRLIDFILEDDQYVLINIV